MDPFHRRLARIAFDASEDLGSVLAGGYAISAHRLTSRPSRDLDFATVSALPLDIITGRLADVYRAAGYDVQVIETAPTMARFEVHDGARECEIDLLKAGIRPPVLLDETFTGYGLDEDDVAALHRWARSWQATSGAGQPPAMPPICPAPTIPIGTPISKAERVPAVADHGRRWGGKPVQCSSGGRWLRSLNCSRAGPRSAS